ncbi:MAG: hypothetical protein J2P36_26910, partial [Ktedonobacteraceae bacterium]|nr:hypothetical protein [Ktedonobacteraceae bacterium]
MWPEVGRSSDRMRLPSGQMTDEAALTVLLEQLRSYLGQRADVADLENLFFSSRHLFACVDSLYLAVLPGLSARATRSVDDLLP